MYTECMAEIKTKSVGLRRSDDIRGTHPVSSISPLKHYTRAIT